MTFRKLFSALVLLASPLLAQPASARPALWRVEDKDTTIFLFGTVHALPKGENWLQGTIAGALLSSDTLATEVLPQTLTDPAFLKRYAERSRLPAGTTLRSLLSEPQRAQYEAAMKKAGIDPAAFDGFKPWFAANALVIAPLMKKGYAAGLGSEQSIEALAPASMRRVALETGDRQLALFDALPLDVQITNLLQVADQLGTVDTRVDHTVAAWLAGDVATVADESEAKDDDPRMAEALLYPRNEAWADWIVQRMKLPGRVFMAVGAGHLAGEHSVQKALAARGIKVTRLQ